VLLSDELWPRQTHLLVEGFDDEGHAKIARGSDWNLVVKADAAVGREIPEIVEVRYSTTDGARGRENMSREGVVSPGQARFQNYAYAFKGVLAPLEFYVRGGDDRQGPFHLDVVESPTIGLTLHCEYPSYMHRTPRDMPMAGLMQVPRGTEIMIRAEANKPLVSAEVVDVTDENAPLVNRLELAQQHGGPQSSFAFGLQALEADKTLLFRLLDADGIRSRDAVRLALGAIPDEPPQVNVQVKGIGTAITPAARLPAAGEVSDDYGVTKIWFDYSVDDAPGHQRPFSAAASGQEKLAVADALEVRDLELQPKQKLHWAVQAADGCTLGSGPNVGTSQRYALEVVTPEQLRSMLEARELSLRRRFETIVEELTETRNLLARVTLPPVAKPSDDAAKETPTGPKDETPAAEDGAPAEQDNAPAPKVDASAQKDAALDSKNDPPAAQPVREAGSEPGDAAESAAAEATRRGAASLAVQVERVLQNGERSAHETLQVALAFDDIREEMINNRVDTEELKTRLKDGVADPLKRIVAEMFPKWEAQLKRLSGELTDPRSAVTAQTAALAQVDAILIEMQQVLDKMLELETFNEVLDMLRQIIDAQEKINAETKQKQKRKIRDLVE
jgi:hypothetical protein